MFITLLILTKKKTLYVLHFYEIFKKHSTLIMFSYTQVSPPGPEGGHS